MDLNKERVRQFVRRFTENGVKLLLEDPGNVRDLLVLAGAAMVGRIDFGRMEVVRTTYVQRDYRHIESDMVLSAPLRRPGGKRKPRVTVYVLIEHQSEPDEWMAVRVLEYVVAIYRTQMRQWRSDHASMAGLRLQPVLPVVFYTGTRRWDDLGRLADRVEMGEEFAAVIPTIQPLFFNLSATESGRLGAEGGWFGQVLRVMREQRAQAREFRGVLREAVEQLEGMTESERLRWQDLLSYLQAVVYHERDKPEREGFYDLIRTSARTAEHRRQLEEMRQTIADAWKEEGAVEAARRMLLRQLRARFGKLRPGVTATIKNTTDLAQLEEWAARFATATTLEEIGIESTS